MVLTIFDLILMAGMPAHRVIMTAMKGLLVRVTVRLPGPLRENPEFKISLVIKGEFFHG